MKLDGSVLIVVVFLAIGGSFGYLVRTGQLEIPGLPAVGVQADTGPKLPEPWPPRVDEAFPDLQLPDHEGNLVQLSTYKGRVLIVESIGMNCKACQAFSGGNVVGPFGEGQSQSGLDSFDRYLRRFGHVDLKDERLLYVQVLFYDLTSQRAPTIEEAHAWAEHFNLDKKPNTLVLVGDSRFLSRETRALIPGFHLVDKTFTVRAEAGNPPRGNLYNHLLPMVDMLLKE